MLTWGILSQRVTCFRKSPTNYKLIQVGATIPAPITDVHTIHIFNPIKNNSRQRRKWDLFPSTADKGQRWNFSQEIRDYSPGLWHILRSKLFAKSTWSHSFSYFSRYGAGRQVTRLDFVAGNNILRVRWMGLAGNSEFSAKVAIWRCFIE